jgi:hypothetical protein
VDGPFSPLAMHEPTDNLEFPQPMLVIPAEAGIQLYRFFFQNKK